jgi:plasmid stabilization system protein ParE
MVACESFSCACAIDDEISQAVDILVDHPQAGVVAPGVLQPGIRRIYLRRIHYYLYYRLSDDLIEIVGFWHTSRASIPPC